MKTDSSIEIENQSTVTMENSTPKMLLSTPWYDWLLAIMLMLISHASRSDLGTVAIGSKSSSPLLTSLCVAWHPGVDGTGLPVGPKPDWPDMRAICKPQADDMGLSGCHSLSGMATASPWLYSMLLMLYLYESAGALE